MTGSLPQKVTEYLAANEKQFVDRLSRAVAIPSVSGDAAYRKHVIEMAEWIKSEFASLGVAASFEELGNEVLDGQEIQVCLYAMRVERKTGHRTRRAASTLDLGTGRPGYKQAYCPAVRALRCSAGMSPILHVPSSRLTLSRSRRRSSPMVGCVFLDFRNPNNC